MQTMWNIARVVPVALVLAFLTPFLAGQEPEAADARRGMAERVAELIANLDADSREARVSAQRELLRIGPAVLPHLPAPELLPNSAVRETVRRIRLAIEEQQARASVAPSRVTLDGGMPLGVALQRVTEQTGNAIDASALPPERMEALVQTGFRETPFWEAFEALSRRGGFQWDIDGRAEGIAVTSPGAEPAPEPLAVDNSGVYRIAVTSAGLRPVAGRPDERILRLEVRFTAEPRLRPLFFAFAGRDLQASAGDRRLPPFSPEARKEIPFGESGKDLRVTWDFRVPGEAAIQTAGLAAQATVLTAAGSEAIAFDDLSRSAGAARRRGGVTVTLEEVAFRDQRNRRRQEGGGRTARLQVAVSYDTGGPAFESHRTWIYHNQAWLEDAGGERIAYDGFTTEMARDGAVAVEYEFDQLQARPDDYKFVYVAPTLLINVPVEVKLAGIPVSPTAGERSQP